MEAKVQTEPNLQTYYKEELRFFKQMGGEFAKKYPKIASRLVIGEEVHPDPHVERLLQGVAFLAARVRLKIDDDFPEITDALLNIVYPHYVRPIPSMSVAEFHLDPQQGKLTSGFTIPRGATLYSRPAGELRCRFRTCYETTLWPLEVVAADWRPPEKLDPAIRSTGSVAVVRLVLRCAPEMSFDKLSLKSLRFYLSSQGSGEGSLIHGLYEVLLHNCSQILIRDPDDRKRSPLSLPPQSLQPVGFADDESLLPYPHRSFDGYRLLQEYFVFPQKFQFLDLHGLEQVCDAGFRESIEILFFISPFEREDRWEMFELGTSREVFRLGCAPLVNLFSQTSEPILLRQTTHEYLVIPDTRRHRSMDVFSVDDVVSSTPESNEIVRYAPYFSFRHSDDHARKQAFWYARRQQAQWRKEGESDVYLTLVDLSGRPMLPDAEAVTARLTCSNRDLPSRLPFGSGLGDFELEGGGPIRQISAIEKPTPSLSPPAGRAAFWRLISHLSLNHLSLVAEGREALQEILQLYNSAGSNVIDRQIQGIRAVESQPHFARVLAAHGIGFARGTLVELEIDEEAFAGSGIFVFANVVDRFLGMYVSLNSFCQLSVRTPQRREALRRWPPRSGRKILL